MFGVYHMMSVVIMAGNICNNETLKNYAHGLRFLCFVVGK